MYSSTNNEQRTDNALTEEEVTFILWYRSLSEQDQNAIYGMLLDEARKNEKTQ